MAALLVRANGFVYSDSGRVLCVFGGLCVDMWRLVHQRLFLCCFDCLLTVFDCFRRLVHCWYSLGRPVTIGTPMVLSVFDDWYSVPFVKRQSKQQKWPLVYQSSYVYTESAEYTKPRKRRYLAKPSSHVQTVATARRPWTGLTVRVYMDVHASGSRSLPRAATLSSTYWWYLQLVYSLSTTVIKFSIFSDPTRKLSALPPELRRIR